MPTKMKLKIVDNSKLREEIDALYEIMDPINIAKWSLSLAKHILIEANIDYESIDEIIEGFRINELWQDNKARMHDVRQAGFKIHKIARECDSELKKTALRVAGHAVSCGHMKEHAMVASDYAIKVMGQLSLNNMEAISLERKWQLNELKKHL